MPTTLLLAMFVLTSALAIARFAVSLLVTHNTLLTRTYVAMLAVLVVWQCSYVLQLAAPPAPLDVVADRLHYSARVLLEPLVLLFVLFLVEGVPPLRPLTFYSLLFSLPLTLIVLTWTDDWHHTMFTDDNPVQALTLLYHVTVNPALNLAYTLVYAALVPLLAIGLLLRRTLALQGKFRAQVFIFALTFVLSLLAQTVYVLYPNRFHGLDITLLMPCVGVAMAAYSVRRYGLFTQMPLCTDTALENLPNPALVFDHNGELRHFNSRMAHLLGLAGADATTATLDGLLSHRPELLQALRNPDLNDPITVNVGETLRWFRPERKPVPPTANHHGGTALQLHDVTATYTHPPLIMQSTYESVLNRLHEVVFEADDRLRLTFVNAAWTRISGISVPRALGTSLLEYVRDPQTRAALESRLQGAPFAPQSLKLQLCFGNGRETWVECTLDMRPTSGGESVGVRGTMTDITAQVLASRAVGRRDEILEAVRVAAHQFLGPGGWQTHIGKVLAAFGAATGASSVRLFRQWETAQGQVLVQAVESWWLTEQVRAAQENTANTPTDITTFFHRNKHLLHNDGFAQWHIDTAPLDVRLNALEQMQLASLLHVPVWSEERIWGIIELGHANPRVHWTEAERGALQIAADVIAAAVERQRDARVIQQQANILQTVASAATDFLQNIDWRSELPRFLARLAAATNAVRVYVYQLLPDNPGYLRIVEQHSVPPVAPLQTGFTPGFHIERYFPRFSELTVRGEPIALHIEDVVPEERAVFEHFGLQSVLWMPFSVKGRVWGGVALDAHDRRVWTADELGAIRIAGQMLGSTIEHADNQQALTDYAAELEARNAELDTFSRLIAHDLKAPLSAIINSATLSSEVHANALPPLLKDNLARIVELGEGLNEMVEQLLWLARLRREKALGIVETDFALDAALGRYRESITAKRIRVQRDRLPVTIGAQAWVTEVLANLVGNAVKYMGDDNPTPCIKITHTPHNDGMVRICVQDNGLGIALSRQATIFDLFTRVQHGEVYGDGLGLALVQQMVHKMGGEVGLQSKPGVGSTFWFTLPLYQA